MYVSEESPDETEGRLIRLVKEAQWQFFEEAFSFAECDAAAIAGSWKSSALAWISDGDVASFLVPFTDESRDSFGLFKVCFPADRDNSGFIGWLANRLKSSCGTGVFVICGSNTARGGIFDYWGYPLALKERVLAELGRLGVFGGSAGNSLPNFEGKTFQVTSSDPHGEANVETTFRFRQYRDVVEADYHGGPVRTGKLIGTLCGNRLSYKYVQANVEGRVRSGQAVTEVGRTLTGKLRLEEHFTWDGGSDSQSGVLVLEEA